MNTFMNGFNTSFCLCKLILNLKDVVECIFLLQPTRPINLPVGSVLEALLVDADPALAFGLRIRILQQHNLVFKLRHENEKE